MSVLRAARTLGQESGWKLSKMAMHKVLFVAQVLHYGRHQRPLFSERIEAWRLGPVVPALHCVTKHLGAQPVPDIFQEPVFGPASTEAKAIREAYALTRHLYPSQLVDFTHRPEGAWHLFFEANGPRKVITEAAILQEWRDMFAAPTEAHEWANLVADDIETGATRHLGYTDERAFRARLHPAVLQ